MTGIIGVAAYILDGYGPMTTMKLQKMTFYCQAAAVARGRALFDDDFEAWRGGPVSVELYKCHRGRFLVRKGEIVADTADVPTVEQKAMIDSVCSRLAPMDGNELSERTHREGPWKEARKGLSPIDPGNQIIRKESMRDYYSRHPILAE